ncbi:uncharacterized protein BYT42DRAFT_344574 [Radiomyces spectabilis]|uniref:uncharacterized protein n=1 Tax=Radiomyces spectabilis TaxID=64574 RepID=UPI00221FA9B1|nr:uncharacterized protein BYT42DRAFT_344574 [Radiomyces spectabilis]KAI8377439.1 hypothetical protein BYT42DRAFT_344574 [Radiomyces spectabilis]
MIDKLYFRGKCEEVFVSPCCLVHQPILERDFPRAKEILESLKGCRGDITDLTAKLHCTPKGIRLVIIDYAGLSTCPRDIRKFLKTYENVHEIAIDHGWWFEIFSRQELLETKALQKFKCREKYVQRSRTPI